MRLILMTTFAMLAFAANSVLTRAGVVTYGTDPGLFAVVRAVAGAAMLAAIVALRGSARPQVRGLAGPASLALYLAGFSLAYLSLDAGVGALLLFGGVQVTMFAGAVWAREPVPARRWAGMGLSLLGLAVLVWPVGRPGGGAVVPVDGAVFMALAAVGWGVYSLLGRGSADPLAQTARNFIWAVPMVAPLLLLGVQATGPGLAMAVVSGAVTSGLGYALWYACVPGLGAARSGLVQLSVPVLAAVGGAVLLAEPPGARFVVAALLVLGGIAVGVWSRRRIK